MTGETTNKTSSRTSGRSQEEFAALALTSLPMMTPKRLRSLIHGRSASTALAALESWRHSARPPVGPLDALLAATPSKTEMRTLGAVWQEALQTTVGRTVDEMSRAMDKFGVSITVLGDDSYPAVLARDPQAPAVLFSIGDLACVEQLRVGIIGTRHATAHGRSCARRFGESLSAHGVGVVSGLARGIDVSAHRGVLERHGREHVSARAGSADVADLSRDGRPIGVVASGLDVIYPPEHIDIWNEVGRVGLLLSESPPGTEPQAFRFPMRNRIIAALCDVLVVVESRTTGGSMITVRAALERGVTVMAVPGSTSTRSAEGTNQLIRDGASIAVEPEDVLAVLGLEAHRRISRFDPRPRPSMADAEILDALGCEPLTLDGLVARARRELADVALALGRLETQGWVMCTGGWFERLAEPGDSMS